MMDEVFGINNFRNDITRIKCNPKNFERIGYGNIKGLILFYSKGERPIWNNPKFEYSEQEIEKAYNKIDANGRRYTTVPIHAPGETKDGNSNKSFKGLYPPKGRHWRCSVEELERLDSMCLIEWSKTGNPRRINYANEHIGKKAQDIWDFKDPMYPLYPTEKNQEMLQFIIKASSNPSSIVMDCFCGSGSTLMAAESCGRRCIGVDKSDVAIDTTKQRFNSVNDGLFADQETYKYIELDSILPKSNLLLMEAI